MKQNIKPSIFIIIILILASFSFYPRTPHAQMVNWYVMDGGWCDLVHVPLPVQKPKPVLAPKTIKKEIQVSQQEVKQQSQTIASSAISSEEGFKLLFNGKNLDGWIIQGMEKAGPKIEEGGVLKVGGWDYWAVITKDQFSNFILRFDVKFDKKGNTGIIIHTPKKEVYKSSFEIQLADDEGKNNQKKWPGAIFGKVAPIKNAFKPIGEWNNIEIKYIAPHIWVVANGVTVQNNLDITKIDGLKHKLTKGGIALQRNDYKKAAYYKNIRIKRLAD